MTLKRQFTTYLGIGVLYTIVGFSIIFIAINLFDASYFLATIVGYAVGVVFSFFMNRRFTFKDTGDVFATFVRFVTVFVFAYSLSYIIGLLLGHIAKGYSQDMGMRVTEKMFKNLAAIAGGAFYTLVGFVGNKLFIFRNT
jgi:putative flippase GtrA